MGPNKANWWGRHGSVNLVRWVPFVSGDMHGGPLPLITTSLMNDNMDHPPSLDETYIVLYFVDFLCTYKVYRQSIALLIGLLN